MANRKTASALRLAAIPLAALLASSFSTRSVSARLTPLIAPMVAQVPPSFPVPDSVASGTELQVSSSSDNMNRITEALKNGFESDYSNAKVAVENKEASAALQDVLSGNADLAAISRPLTDAEKAQNLIAVAARREKIAIIVGKNNPFTKSLTGSQFAQIFRGEITNWQEVGGPNKPIRVIDRPDTSETRQALKPYPVFASQPFETGSNATQANQDSIEAIASELGDDGISYALVGQLEGQSDIKAIRLHQTLPDDPKYPFSQPYSFVYAGAASPAVKAFLGYATGAPGQAALNNANLSGYAVAPAGGAATTAAANGSGAGSNAAGGTGGNAATGNNGNAGVNANGSTNGSANGSTVDPAGNGATTGGTVTDADGNVVTLEEGDAANGNLDGAADADGRANDLAERGRWWWLLLPLAGLGLLIWAASKRGAEEETGYMANADRDDAVLTNYRGAAGAAGAVGDTTYPASDVDDKVSAGKTSRAVAGGAALAGGAAAAGAGLSNRAGEGLSERASDVTPSDATASNITASDITPNLEGTQGSARTGIDSVKGSTQSGLGNLRSNIQGGVDGNQSSAQGGIDGAQSRLQRGIGNFKGNVQGSSTQESNVSGTMDSTRGTFQSGIEGVKGRNQGGIDSFKGGIDNVTSGAKGNVDGTSGNIQSGADLGDRSQSSIDATKRNASETGSSWLDRAKQRINEAADQAKDKASDVKDDITGNR